MTFPTIMASQYFVFLSAGDGKPNFWQQAAYLGGKVLQFAFPVLFVLLVDRRFPLPKRPHFAGVGWGMAFGVAVAVGMLALYYGWLGNTWLFDGTGASVQQKLREVNMLSPAKYVVMSVVIVAVHSLAEEYYWRWFTFAQLTRLVSLPLAMAAVERRVRGASHPGFERLFSGAHLDRGGAILAGNRHWRRILGVAVLADAIDLFVVVESRAR